MSLAWASIAIVLLLLPGVFFFIGLASYERLSREIIRSGVVSEVALATAIAIGIHFVLISSLSLFGFGSASSLRRSPSTQIFRRSTSSSELPSG